MEQIETKKNTTVKQYLESMFAYLYLDNLYHDKYRSIIYSLNSHKSLGNDQCPITIANTNNVLINHKFGTNKNNKQDHKH